MLRSPAKNGILDFLYLLKLHFGSTTALAWFRVVGPFLLNSKMLFSLFTFFFANLRHNLFRRSFSVTRDANSAGQYTVSITESALGDSWPETWAGFKRPEHDTVTLVGDGSLISEV